MARNPRPSFGGGAGQRRLAPGGGINEKKPQAPARGRLVKSNLGSRLKIGGLASPRFGLEDKVINDTGQKSVTQRGGPLSELPGLLQELGVDALPVFDGSGIDPVDLSPDTPVRFADLLPLLERATRQADCPHLGLVLGLRFDLMKHHGPIGRLMLTAPSVRQALIDCVSWQLGYSKGAIVYLNQLGDDYIFGYGTYSASGPGTRVLYDIIVGVAVRIVRELTDGAETPIEVHFCHRQPDDPNFYKQLLKHPMRFNQQHNGILLGAETMRKRPPYADPDLRQRLLGELPKKMWETPPSLADQVGHALRHSLHVGKPTITEVSKQLGLHPRTLRRRLASEGTTFAALRDDVRFSVARELLDLTDIPIGEIGAILSFASPGVFSETFRRWTGATPM